MERTIKAKKTSIFTTSNMVKIALLSVIAFVLMMIELPVMFFPEFLKMDISDLPAIIGGFAIGPVAGVAIELIKNILKFVFKTTSGGVGEFANFAIGGAFVFISSGIYHMKKTKKNAIIGCIAGTVAMAAFGAAANYYVLIPFYSNFMPIDAIISMGTAVNKNIVDLKTLILYAIVPFNIFKGIAISLITAVIYKKISVILK